MTSTARRRLPPEERRDQLLDVAADIVLHEGFGAVTIDRVAREAGIARTVVYAQFENLAGLVHALADRAEQRALEQVGAVVPEKAPEGRDPDDVLVEGMRTFLRLVRDNPRTWRLVLFPVEGAPPMVRHRIARGRAAVVARLEPLIAWGIDQRGGPSGLDTDLLARSIVSLGEDAARAVLADPQRYSPERLADFAAKFAGALRRGSS